MISYDKQATAALIAASIMDELHPHILRAIAKALEGEVEDIQPVNFTQEDKTNLLSDEFVRCVEHTGSIRADYYDDGGGLWLRVTPSYGAHWEFRYIDPVTGKHKGFSTEKGARIGIVGARHFRDLCKACIQQKRDPAKNQKKMLFAAQSYEEKHRWNKNKEATK